MLKKFPKKIKIFSAESEKTTIKDYLEDMKNLQINLLDFLDSEENMEEKFDNIFKLITDPKLSDDKHKFISFLHLLTKISNNHHCNYVFFDKIKKIILNCKDIIKNYYSNHEIFNIFKSNKMILLFLIEQKMIEFDDYIVKKIIKRKYVEMKYPQFFLPEIQPFIKEKWFTKKINDDDNNDDDNKDDDDNMDDDDYYSKKKWIKEIKKEIPEHFYENRKKGQNEHLICQLIQNDSIKDFIAFVNKNNYSLQSTIEPSIYETNPFLAKKQRELIKNDNDCAHGSYYKYMTLIEYTCFYGSIQIFNYLRLNNVKLDESLLIYAIHGQNPEIIHILEDETNKVKNEDIYEKCFLESIKCHHVDISNYFLNNYLQENTNNYINQYLKYYNFLFIQIEMFPGKDIDYFVYNICQYDYSFLVNVLLNNIKDTAFNKKIKRSGFGWLTFWDLSKKDTEYIEFDWILFL